MRLTLTLWMHAWVAGDHRAGRVTWSRWTVLARNIADSSRAWWSWCGGHRLIRASAAARAVADGLGWEGFADRAGGEGVHADGGVGGVLGYQGVGAQEFQGGAHLLGGGRRVVAAQPAALGRTCGAQVGKGCGGGPQVCGVAQGVHQAGELEEWQGQLGGVGVPNGVQGEEQGHRDGTSVAFGVGAGREQFAQSAAGVA